MIIIIIYMATIFNIIQSDVIGGGMENIFLEYSRIIHKNQDKIGAKLICIISKNFCHKKLLEQENIQIETLNIKGHFDIFAAVKLHFLIKKYSPNLIMAHNGRGFAAINLCKKIFGIKNIKTIAVSHGGNIKRILEFDYIIAVAKHIEEKVKNTNFKGLVTTIYNGCKQSNFIKNNSPQNGFVFGILTRLSKEKNTPAAIKAFKKFNEEIEKESLLIIAGDGEERSDIETLVHQLKLEEKVKFIGWVKNKEAFFNQINVFLQPTLKEALGITILESFNYQTPVIAANAFGPKEIIENEVSGYLFDPNDENSLFEVMKKSYLQKENLSRITNNARRSLEEKFSYEIMEEKLVESLKSKV